MIEDGSPVFYLLLPGAPENVQLLLSGWSWSFTRFRGKPQTVKMDYTPLTKELFASNIDKINIYSKRNEKYRAFQLLQLLVIEVHASPELNDVSKAEAFVKLIDMLGFVSTDI